MPTYQSSTVAVQVVGSTGIYPLGRVQTGSVNIRLEGAGLTGTIGFLNASGVFTAYADGTVGANSSTVVDCGNGTIPAVSAVGTGTIVMAGI